MLYIMYREKVRVEILCNYKRAFKDTYELLATINMIGGSIAI